MGEGRGEGGEPQAASALSSEPDVRLELPKCEIATRAQVESHVLDQPPGRPLSCFSPFWITGHPEYPTKTVAATPQITRGRFAALGETLSRRRVRGAGSTGQAPLLGTAGPGEGAWETRACGAGPSGGITPSLGLPACRSS